MRAAAIQFCPTFGKKTANLQALNLMIRQAAAAGAELIVLPELCATGYSFLSKAQALAVAEPLTPEGPTLRGMLAIARELDVHLVWGFVELDPGTGDLHNAQAYVDPTGFYVGMRKVNRWGNDFLWAKPGLGNPPVIRATFRNEVRKVGLLICRDVRDKVNDTWTSLYSRGDADVVCLSANWGDGGFPAVSWMEFVERNHCALVVSNRYGKEQSNDFGEGGICIIEPSGDVTCEGLQWSADCIVFGAV